MKRDMDKVTFESRTEIGAIIRALEEWQDTHPHDEKTGCAQELVHQLDIMSMEW